MQLFIFSKSSRFCSLPQLFAAYKIPSGMRDLHRKRHAPQYVDQTVSITYASNLIRACGLREHEFLAAKDYCCGNGVACGFVLGFRSAMKRVIDSNGPNNNT